MGMRFDLQTPQPPQPLIDGDKRFTGLNMKAAPEHLASGYISRSENCRINKGVETRPGTRTPLWANLFSARSFLGSGVYSNPNGFTMGLLACRPHTDDPKVLGIRYGTVPIEIAVQTDFSGDVEFTQHFDKVLAQCSDPSVPTQVWDGISPEDGFIEVTSPTDLGAGIKGIPNPPYSINYLGRAWFPIPGTNDQIGASDKNDPTIYDADLHTFRVNTGNSDTITGLFPFLGNNIIIGKDRSIDMIPNIPDDLGDAFLNAIYQGINTGSPPPPQVVEVSSTVGIVARKCALMAGGRFMFLSNFGEGGIYQIGTDEHGRYIVDPVPVSEPVEPLIRRINWTYADKAVANSDGKYAYFAVPFDNCTYNNAVLVYNLATREWESLDTWNSDQRDFGAGPIFSDDNPMRIDNLLFMPHYGSSHLFAFNNGGAVVDGVEHTCKIHLMYRGTDDQLALAAAPDNIELETYPIQSCMEERGYSLVDADGRANKESQFVSFFIATLQPSLEFYQLIDGSGGNELPLTDGPVLLSRTAYDLVKKDYALSNANDDAAEPRRGDYAVLTGDAAKLGLNGIAMQRVTARPYDFVLNAQGRVISFRIVNRTGIYQIRDTIFGSMATRGDSRAAA